MKVLVDMNLSQAWAQFLNENGIQSSHWSELGANDTPDPVIMAYAAAQNYAILTRDLDFSTALAMQQISRPSVIQIRAKRATPEGLGQQVLSALRQMQAEIERGALITIQEKRTRMRILPLLSEDDLF